jgi:2'-5' RNA ligase superfamily protein
MTSVRAGCHTAAVEPTESALIVAVPEAEPAVAALRAAYDPAASWGVPAHVTVLYPFLPPDRLDAGVRAAVREAVGAVPAFDLVFGRTRRFGDQVLWLAPQPEAPLRALTAAVWARFPQTPPYGGQFADVVPHLTVTDGQPPAVMDAAAERVRPWLPITARPRAVRLMVGRREPDAWQTVAEFPLSAGRRPA